MSVGPTTVEWVMQTSALHQKKGIIPRARNRDEISRYVVDVLKNGDSNILRESPTKELVDLSITAGRAVAESLDSDNFSKDNYLDEVMELYNGTLQDLKEKHEDDEDMFLHLEFIEGKIEEYVKDFGIKVNKEIPPPPLSPPPFNSKPFKPVVRGHSLNSSFSDMPQKDSSRNTPMTPLAPTLDSYNSTPTKEIINGWESFTGKRAVVEQKRPSITSDEYNWGVFSFED